MALSVLASPSISAQEDERERIKEFSFDADIIQGDLFTPTSMGVTAGGNQDIYLARDHIARGSVPRTGTFTADPPLQPTRSPRRRSRAL